MCNGCVEEQFVQVFLKLTRNTKPDCFPSPHRAGGMLHQSLGACCPPLHGHCTVPAQLLSAPPLRWCKTGARKQSRGTGRRERKDQLREHWIRQIHLMIKQTRLFAYKMQRHINLLGANCLLYSSWYCSSWLPNDKGTFRKRRKHFVPRLWEGSIHPPTTAGSRAHLSVRFGTETQAALGDMGNALHYKNKHLMKRNVYILPMPRG